MTPDKIDLRSGTALPGSTKEPGRTVRRAVVGAAWCVAVLLSVWCVAALYFDLPWPRMRLPGALGYALVVPAAIVFVRAGGWRLAICLGGFAIVLLCWLSLKPSNDGNWQADVAQTAWAEVSGDIVTIHNYRDCRYRTESEYSCEWKIKTVRLSELRGIDVAFIHWGIPKIAHIIVSFHFAGDDYVAVSVEMRKQVGQSYSAIRGFFRRYTLIYIFADERDLIRLRSNFRQGEEVDLYRSRADAEYSKQLFLQYLRRANELHERAEWYNALTSNCTTNIFSEMLAIGPLPSGMSRFDPRLVFSGEADKMLYDHGLLAGNLPFAQLREQSRINPSAQAAGNSPDFSRVIRAGRAGFESQSPEEPAR
jgi:hypothetical protein